jgi:hypothetical protein
MIIVTLHRIFSLMPMMPSDLPLSLPKLTYYVGTIDSDTFPSS